MQGHIAESFPDIRNQPLHGQSNNYLNPDSGVGSENYTPHEQGASQQQEESGSFEEVPLELPLEDHDSDLKSNSVTSSDDDEQLCSWKQVNLVGFQPPTRLTCQVEVDGGVTSTALVDTGSDLNFIHQSVIDQTNLKINNNVAVKIRGIGSANFSHITGKVSINLKVHDIKCKPSEFYVIPRDQQTLHPIILGNWFLFDNKIIADGKRKRLTFTDGLAGQVDLYLADSNEPCIKVIREMPVKATCAVTLNPGVSVRVPVSWNFPLVPEAVPCTNCSDDNALLYYNGEVKTQRFHDSVKGLEGIFDSYMKSPVVLLTSQSTKVETVRPGDTLGSLSTLINLTKNLSI